MTIYTVDENYKTGELVVLSLPVLRATKQLLILPERHWDANGPIQGNGFGYRTRIQRDQFPTSRQEAIQRYYDEQIAEYDNCRQRADEAAARAEKARKLLVEG